MKNTFYIAAILCMLACNNSGKSSVEKADSANAARLDSGLQHNETVIDEGSSTFLVRAFNINSTEEKLAGVAHMNASNSDLKSFAAMLHHHHTALSDSIRSLAIQKKIVLPTSITDEKMEKVNEIEHKKGTVLDKDFLSAIIKIIPWLSNSLKMPCWMPKILI